MMSKIISIFVLYIVLDIALGQQQYTSVNELPRNVHRLKLDGIVTSVHEGDTIMFYHAPDDVPIPRKISYRDTMIVRLVGIRAPRMGRPGKPGEPLAEESRAELERQLLNKRVRLDLFAKDYSDQLWGSIFTGNDYVSLKMVDKGLATILTDYDAVYGDIRRALFMAESVARRKRVGVWSLEN